MITSRNEFETIPAFTVIAGSTNGGWTTRDFCAKTLEALDSVVGFNSTFDYWKNLAKTHDDDIAELDDLLDDLINCWNNTVETMPDYCYLTLHDNELIILPDVQYALEDTFTVDTIPDGLNPIRNDYGHHMHALTHVNDHGNVDYLKWDDSKREYVIEWSVV